MSAEKKAAPDDVAAPCNKRGHNYAQGHSESAHIIFCTFCGDVQQLPQKEK